MITWSGIVSVSFWVFVLGYFVQKPVYMCQFAKTVTQLEKDELCTAEYICEADSRILDWHIDDSNSKTLQNWQQRLDLMCVPSWKVGMIGTSFFIGWASTLLWLPRFGDKFGRQKVFAAGMTLNLVMFALMMWTTDLNVVLASSFF